MDNDLILDMFIFETRQLIDQLEQIMLFSEKTNSYDSGSINEIFRIMHTIKGSSAMMSYSDLSELAHSMEDLFAFLRGNESAEFDYSKLTDMILKGLDFIKDYIAAIEEGRNNKPDASPLVNDFDRYLSELKGGKKNVQGSNTLPGWLPDGEHKGLCHYTPVGGIRRQYQVFSPGHH